MLTTQEDKFPNVISWQTQFLRYDYSLLQFIRKYQRSLNLKHDYPLTFEQLKKQTITQNTDANKRIYHYQLLFRNIRIRMNKSKKSLGIYTSLIFLRIFINLFFSEKDAVSCVTFLISKAIYMSYILSELTVEMQRPITV